MCLCRLLFFVFPNRCFLRVFLSEFFNLQNCCFFPNLSPVSNLSSESLSPLKRHVCTVRTRVNQYLLNVSSSGTDHWVKIQKQIKRFYFIYDVCLCVTRKLMCDILQLVFIGSEAKDQDRQSWPILHISRSFSFEEHESEYHLINFFSALSELQIVDFVRECVCCVWEASCRYCSVFLYTFSKLPKKNTQCIVSLWWLTVSVSICITCVSLCESPRSWFSSSLRGAALGGVGNSCSYANEVTSSNHFFLLLFCVLRPDFCDL